MSGVQIVRTKDGGVKVECALDFVEKMAKSFKLSPEVEQRIQQNREQIIATSFKMLEEYRAVRQK
ncbi:MAG: hypothetical protein UIC65_05355 [Alphaproteobacteria bacterium]|nr:hypothetical protein [Alphaproteobacteria bacterium]